MKKLFLGISMVLCMLPLVSNAQTSSETLKERKEIRKMSKSELNEKASKAARKEAKKLITESQGKLKAAKKTIDKTRKNQINMDIFNLGKALRKAKPEKMSASDTEQIKALINTLKNSTSNI